MNNSNILLWLPVEIAGNLPLVKKFEPVSVWDNDSKQFTDEQEKKDGLPVWEAQALLKIGWNANLTPVRIRIVSASVPQLEPNPNALMSILNIPQPRPVSTHKEG